MSSKPYLQADGPPLSSNVETVEKTLGEHIFAQSMGAILGKDGGGAVDGEGDLGEAVVGATTDEVQQRPSANGGRRFLAGRGKVRLEFDSSERRAHNKRVLCFPQRRQRSTVRSLPSFTPKRRSGCFIARPDTRDTPAATGVQSSLTLLRLLLRLLRSILATSVFAQEYMPFPEARITKAQWETHMSR